MRSNETRDSPRAPDEGTVRVSQISQSITGRLEVYRWIYDISAQNTVWCRSGPWKIQTKEEVIASASVPPIAAVRIHTVPTRGPTQTCLTERKEKSRRRRKPVMRNCGILVGLNLRKRINQVIGSWRTVCGYWVRCLPLQSGSVATPRTVARCATMMGGVS